MRHLFARNEDYDLGSIVAAAEQRSVDLTGDPRNVGDDRVPFASLPHADEPPRTTRFPAERRRDRAVEVGIRRRIERTEATVANHERVLPGEKASSVAFAPTMRRRASR